MSTRVAKGASKLDTSRSPSLFYGSAREGMLDLLNNLPSSRAQGVLLPAYIGWSPNEGSGVFDPVKASGRPVDFYALNDDLTVDLTDLKAQVQSGLYQVLLVIHYFGRIQPGLAEITGIAQRNGMVVVEDLAHALYTSLVTKGAGVTGDVNLYSLHKMLPTSGGGFATYRNRSILSGQSSSSPQYAVELASYDLAEIAERRRSNFQALTDFLQQARTRDTLFRFLWPELRPDEVPQSLPVVVAGNGRDAIYAAMNADGYGMVSLYHTLIPELGDRFPRMSALARHIINFPIHQDVARADLEPMAQRFMLALEHHG